MPDDIAPTPPFDCSMCSEFLTYSREENRRLRHSVYFWLAGMSLAAAVLLVVGLKHV